MPLSACYAYDTRSRIWYHIQPTRILTPAFWSVFHAIWYRFFLISDSGADQNNLIVRIFLILKTNRILPFCNLFQERRWYHLYLVGVSCVVAVWMVNRQQHLFLQSCRLSHRRHCHLHLTQSPALLLVSTLHRPTLSTSPSRRCRQTVWVVQVLGWISPVAAVSTQRRPAVGSARRRWHVTVTRHGTAV